MRPSFKLVKNVQINNAYSAKRGGTLTLVSVKSVLILWAVFLAIAPMMKGACHVRMATLNQERPVVTVKDH